MSDDVEWGPWIDHDGKGCPCVGEFGHVIYDTGHEFVCIIEGTPAIWDLDVPSKHRAIRYRIRKPKGMAILNAILREVERIPELV